MDEIFKTAIQASVEAGQAIIQVYQKDFEVISKDDLSPLTEADIASNDIINTHLNNTSIPIISEENKQIDFEIRSNWDLCWIVDPLDGTKEFVKRNGEFTVNIALCEGGKPLLGVIYVPVSGDLYYGNTLEQKAYKTKVTKDYIEQGDLFNDVDRIMPENNSNNVLRIVGSRSHMNKDTENFISEVKKDFTEIEIVSKGSSLKFCLVAEGKADIYPRFAPTMEWDTAAGQAICEAVGLKVISQQTQNELLYNKENLLNPYFVVHHP